MQGICIVYVCLSMEGKTRMEEEKVEEKKAEGEKSEGKRASVAEVLHGIFELRRGTPKGTPNASARSSAAWPRLG